VLNLSKHGIVAQNDEFHKIHKELTNYLNVFVGCFADSTSQSALGDSSHYLDYYDASPQTCTSLCGEDGK